MDELEELREEVSKWRRLRDKRESYSVACRADIVALEEKYESESVELVSIEHLAMWDMMVSKLEARNKRNEALLRQLYEWDVMDIGDGPYWKSVIKKALVPEDYGFWWERK